MAKVLILWVLGIFIFFAGYWLGKRITEFTYKADDVDYIEEDKKDDTKWSNCTIKGSKAEQRELFKKQIHFFSSFKQKNQ